LDDGIINGDKSQQGVHYILLEFVVLAQARPVPINEK
jgi:hypothetical protein